MRLTIEKTESDLIVRYRVYHRQGSSFKTYIARIVGPHPNYILSRSFAELWVKPNPRWNLYTSLLPFDGIYEVSVKRYDAVGNYLSRERQWLILFDGEAYVYADEEMNNQYVLYCAGLLESMRERVS